jgi:hypothetical protein
MENNLAIAITAAAGFVAALAHAFVAVSKELRAWRGMANKRSIPGAKARNT